MSKNEFDQISSKFHDFLIEAKDFELVKKIGEGGFGEVFYGKHKRTGKECAIKKLFIDKLQRQQFIGFTREVSILATCNNYFLLPFYGFTETTPFLIVTQYIRNGSLFNALRRRKNSPVLNGTNKTIIALGIAYGMESLHSKGIIHRDLKSMNILLDDELLPKICDFGVSRFVNEEKNVMTKEIGTPHWMAPELFESNNYTYKVDVYAYGILLWEMLTEEVPFKDKEGYQIALAVCTKKERPPIPDHTPKELKNLINSCWNQDPKKRPKFEDIIKHFESKDVSFPKTEKNAIEFLKKKRNQKNSYPHFNQMYSNEIGKEDFNEETKMTNLYSDSKDPFKRHSSAEKDFFAGLNFTDYSENDQEPDYSSITQTDNPNFKRNLQSCVRNLQPNNADKFFNDIISTFSSSMSSFVLSNINTIIRNNPKIFDIFVNSDSHIITKLPFDNEENINASLTIILYCVKNRPDIITKNLLNYIFQVVSKEPSKVLCIIVNCAKSFDALSNNKDFSEFVLQQSVYEAFLNSSSDREYLQLINFMITSYSQFREGRLDGILNVILYSLNLDDKPKTIHSAFMIFNSCLPTDTTLLPDELLIKLSANNDKIQNDIVSYYLRRPNIPLPTEIILFAIKTSSSNKGSYALFLSATDRPDFVDNLLKVDDSWLVDGSLPLCAISTVILNSLQQKKKRKEISQMHNMPNFLIKLLTDNGSTSGKTKSKSKKKSKKKEKSKDENNDDDNDKPKDKEKSAKSKDKGKNKGKEKVKPEEVPPHDLIEPSMTIVSAMLKAKKIVAKIAEAGYFSTLATVVTQPENSDLVKPAVELAEKLAKTAAFAPYLASFIRIFAAFFQRATQNTPEETQAALAALAAACRNREEACAEAKECKLDEMISQLGKNPVYQSELNDACEVLKSA